MSNHSYGISQDAINSSSLIGQSVSDTAFQTALLSGINQLDGISSEQFYTEIYRNISDLEAQAQIKGDQILLRQIRQVSRNMGSPEIQAEIRKSFDTFRESAKDIADSVDRTNTQKSVDLLKIVGKSAGTADTIITAVSATQKLATGDVSGAGADAATSAVSGILAAAAAGIVTAILGAFGASGSLVLAAGVIAGATAGFFVNLILPGVLDDLTEKLTDILVELDPLDLMPIEIQAGFDDAKDWEFRRRDPLALDLDGDGIETTGAESVVAFDHNGNDLKNGSGWVNADDAFLVHDKDSDGRIDSGAELFGVDTVKSDGSLAVDGFDALQDLDSNSDGVFDTKDSAFSDVQIWQDLDQDGVTDNGELKSLAEANIASIELSGDNNPIDLGNGNLQSSSSSFTFTDGSTGTVANLDLVENTFNREFTDIVEYSQDAEALPDTKGSGLVRDLKESASLSADLSAAIQAVLTEDTYLDQLDQLDTVVELWSDTAAMQGSTDFADSLNINLYYLTPGLSLEELLTDSPNAELSETIAAQQETVRRIEILEKFNASNFVTIDSNSVINGNGELIELEAIDGSIRSQAAVVLSSEQVESINDAYDKLKLNLYDTLNSQTRIKEYTDLVTLDVDSENKIVLNFDAMNEQLELKRLESPLEALADLMNLTRYYGEGFGEEGWTGGSLLDSWYEESLGIDFQEGDFDELEVESTPTTFWGTERSEIVLGSDQFNQMFGNNGNDTIYGAGNNDDLYGGEGDDVIYGGTGNDKLTGDSGNDLLFGGEGKDELSGSDGDDILRGGLGNDTLDGGKGNDTYHVELEGGFDTIVTTVHSIGDGSDAGSIDTLVFGDGIAEEDLKWQRISYSLYITINDTDDEGQHIKNKSTDDGVILSGFFHTQEHDFYRIEFSGGSTLNLDQIKEDVKTIQGHEGTDFMKAFETDDILYGHGGNDRLEGMDGDDILYGGRGDDRLWGGAGSDTYYFGRDSGTDIIRDSTSDSNLDDVNRLVFDSDIGIDELSWYRIDDDLAFEIVDDGSIVRLESFFIDNDARLQEVLIDAGPELNLAQIEIDVRTIVGGDSNDTLQGYELAETIVGGGGDDTLSGGGGNDSIYGNAGHDYVIGGEGDDALFGGEGNDLISAYLGDDIIEGGEGDDRLFGDFGDDTYHWNIGDGNDEINVRPNFFGDWPIGSTNDDRIVFGADVKPEDVSWTRNQNDLLLHITSSNESITINSYFTNETYKLAQAVFTDGSELDFEAIEFDVTQLRNGSEGGPLSGYETDDTIRGGIGNDRLSGNEGDDTIYGGDGYDRLEGDEGNDTLRGGNQDDNLNGGDGDDYAHGGNGNDIVVGGRGADRLFGGNGDDNLFGDYDNDRLVAGRGNDVLNGGFGDDYLRGEQGNDTYRWGEGYGNDIIVDANAIDKNDATHVDKLVFNSDITIEDLSWKRLGNHLLFTHNASGETIRINNHFLSDNHRIESIELNDGTELDLEQIELDSISLIGTSANDRLNGRSFGDLMSGGAGNDVLLGRSGDDIMNGEQGNDRLIGGYGNDRYVFDSDFGRDTIVINPSDNNGSDVAVFDDLSQNDLSFDRVGDHLRIDVNGSTNRVTVKDWYKGREYQLDSIETTSGAILNGQIDLLVDAMASTSPSSGVGSISQVEARDEPAFLVETLKVG